MERTITGAPIKRAQITVKGKVFDLSATEQYFAIAFNKAPETDFSGGHMTVQIADLGMTRFGDESYLDTGLMIFGPLTDEAACTIAELIKPDVTH